MALSNITLVDKSGDNVVFQPYKVEPSAITFVDRSPGILSTWRTLRFVRTSPVQTTKGVTRIRGELSVPIWNATLNAVTDIPRGYVDLVIPVSATPAQQGDLVALVSSLANHVVFREVAETGVLPL